VGDREAQLREALRRLENEQIHVARVSSIYETEPQDFANQPWFLNLAVEVETVLDPQQLLAQIQEIEKALGRTRDVSKGPRTIDIDILFYDSAVIETATLQIPHPSIAQRRFVLAPLAEIAPNFKHPLTKRTAAEMLPATGSQIVKRITSPARQSTT